jgi:hypothetical protein
MAQICATDASIWRMNAPQTTDRCAIAPEEIARRADCQSTDRQRSTTCPNLNRQRSARSESLSFCLQLSPRVRLVRAPRSPPLRVVEPGIRRPSLPIDFLVRKDVQPACQGVVLGEDDQVFARPTRARNNETIAPEKGHGCPDFLSATIVDAFILRHVEVQLLEIGAEKSQSALGHNAEAVKHRRPTGPRRELAPVEGNLGQSSFTQQARVERWNQPFRRPTTATGRGRERIEAPARRSKHLPVKPFCFESVELLQQ